MSSISLIGLYDSVTQSMHNADKEDEILYFENEMDVVTRIEKVRQELHSIIDHYDEKGFNDKIVEVSQYLDRLLVAYERSKERAI